jgi:VacB/RNase II family 3'-5' exoribonuclease
MTTGLHADDRSVTLLAEGLAAIRRDNDVPEAFSPEVLEAAEHAARRPLDDRRDLTDLPVVTLDPAGSTDLDQAFTLERAGSDLLLHYAIADVAWFVRPGDPVDLESWRRGVTLYLPDAKAALHPPVLAEDVASLLPSGPRPAVVFTVRVADDGAVRLDRAEKAIVRSRAKLAYDSVTPDELPEDFAEFARRIAAAEEARGSGRVEFPEQEVHAVGDGRYSLSYRPRLTSEDHNAAMSLATNMAVADALLAAGTGLFRVMAEPDERRINRLRHTATALGLDWPSHQPLSTFERTLTTTDPRAAAFLLAMRRASGGASYAPHVPGVVPWHAAMAATYAHATAPLRRLGDRYVVEAAVAVASGREVPAFVTEAFDRLPTVMREAEARANRIDRDVVDLVETVVLHGREGDLFEAVVTDVDDRGARIQLCDPAVVARVSANDVVPGDDVRVRLVSSDPVSRRLQFERVN